MAGRADLALPHAACMPNEVARLRAEESAKKKLFENVAEEEAEAVAQPQTVARCQRVTVALIWHCCHTHHTHTYTRTHVRSASVSCMSRRASACKFNERQWRNCAPRPLSDVFVANIADSHTLTRTHRRGSVSFMYIRQEDSA